MRSLKSNIQGAVKCKVDYSVDSLIGRHRLLFQAERYLYSNLGMDIGNTLKSSIHDTIRVNVGHPVWYFIRDSLDFGGF